jgi:hypothetical protein
VRPLFHVIPCPTRGCSAHRLRCISIDTRRKVPIASAWGSRRFLDGLRLIPRERDALCIAGKKLLSYEPSGDEHAD